MDMASQAERVGAEWRKEEKGKDLRRAPRLVPGSLSPPWRYPRGLQCFQERTRRVGKMPTDADYAHKAALVVKKTGLLGQLQTYRSSPP